MPIYDVTVQGKVYEVDAPDEQTAWNWANYTHRMEAAKPPKFEPLPVPKEAPETGFIPSVKRGFYQTGMLMGDVLPAMVARGLGYDEYAEKQWKEAAETEKMIKERFPQEVPSFTDIKDVKTALSYVTEAVGENLASIIPSLFTAGTAGLLTAGARKAALEAAEKVAENEIKKAMAAGPLQQGVIAGIQKKALDAGVQQARVIAARSDVGGALVGSALQNIPEVYQNIKEATGREDIGAALIFGGINSGLDALMPISLLRKARNMNIPTEELGAAFYKRFATGLGKGFLQEGATEFAQEVSSAAAEKFVDENQEFFSRKNLIRFIDAGLKGGIGGGIITGTTDVITGKGPKRPVSPTDEVEQDVTSTETAPPPAPPAPPPADEEKKQEARLLSPIDEVVQDVTPPKTEPAPAGTGVSVAGVAGEQPATGGAGAAPAGGMAPTDIPAGQSDAGKGAPAPALNVEMLMDEIANLEEQNKKRKGELDADIAAGGPKDGVEALVFSHRQKKYDRVQGEIDALKQKLAAAIPAPAPAPAPAPTEGLKRGFLKDAEPIAEAPAPAPAEPKALTQEQRLQELQLKNIKQDIDELNSLKALLGGSQLSARRTQQQIELDEQTNARVDALAGKYGVTRRKNETTAALIGRIEKAVQFGQEVAEKGLSGISPQLIAEQELKGQKKYPVTPEQEALYADTAEVFNQSEEDEDRKLPALSSLTEDERRVYFQEHITAANTGEEHDRAAEALSDYLEAKRSESRAAKKPGEREKAIKLVIAQDKYTKQRDAFSRKTGLSYAFPAWGSLSDESKRLFASINQTDTANEQFLAFNAVRKQIQKEKAEQQSRQQAAQMAADIGAQQYRAAEEARKGQPSGKGVPLPESILEKLFAGKISGKGGVLEYLLEQGKGVQYKGQFSKYLNTFSREIFRALAGSLNAIENFKVNVVFDENMVYDEIAKYDADTNTIYVGPYGLDEATILHELVHAATVKVINQYFVDKSKLDPRAVRAVEHLIRIAAAAENTLGSKYPNAFENIYEFVAYAFTDLDFQNALARVRVPSLARATAQVQRTPLEVRTARDIGLPTQTALVSEDEIRKRELKAAGRLEIAEESDQEVRKEDGTLWNYFTKTLAYMYKIFYPKGKRTNILQLTEETKLTKASTKDEIQRRKELEGKALTPGQRKILEEEQAVIEGLGLDEKPKKLSQNLIDKAEELGLEERPLTSEDVETLRPGRLFDRVKDETEKDTKFDVDTAAQYGLTNLRRAILREPGYKGNLLLEASSIFEDLLAAPEGGISQLGGKVGIDAGLAARKKGAAGKKTEQVPGVQTRTAAEITNAHPLGGRQTTTTTIKQKLSNPRLWETVVKKFQNAAAPLKRIQEFQEKLGRIVHTGKGLNNFWTQMTLSSGKGWWNFVNKVAGPSRKFNELLEKFADSAGLSVEDALKTLHSYAIVLHEPERRRVKYIKNVPLDEDNKTIKVGNNYYTPAAFRDMLYKSLAHPSTTTADAVKYRQMLDSVVDNPKNWIKMVGPVGKKVPPDPSLFDINNMDKYNVIGLTNIDEYNNLKAEFDSGKYDQALLDQIMDVTKEIHAVTEQLNKEANYRGQGVDNVIAFYGYQNYVPFKGRPGLLKPKEVEEANQDLDPFTSYKVGADLNEKEYSFGGRQTDSENPFLQTLAEGTRAALRAGRKDLTLAIKNAVEQGILSGDTKTRIKFDDRFLNSDALKPAEGEKKILHYEPNGDIIVIKLTDAVQSEAIRRTYREINPLLEKANAITSAIGQTHTRFNVSFAPMNFVRDALTNAYSLGAEFGPQASMQLINSVAKQVAHGGLHKAGQVAYLLSRGETEKVQQMAKADKTGFISDMLEYLEIGGRVAYLQGLAARTQLDSVIKEAGRNKVLKTGDQVAAVFDWWTDTFEYTSRVASYRVLKQTFTAEAMKRGLSEAQAQEEAKIRAAEYAKNFANFEQVGEWGKGMGAAFMFFRPAATGAVRAIDALRPVFGFNEDQFRLRAKAAGATPEQIDQAVIKEMKRVDSARTMVAGLLGMGVAVWMMAWMLSDDEEQGRNKISIDDSARWTRYARFFIPGMEKPVQIPWGFGLGAFASAGAQIAAAAFGTATPKEVLNNIVGLGFDNFLPLPVSRIGMFDNFPAFLMDSVTPSIGRPFLEYVMNVDALGREIYNNRQSRVGDAYTGGDNIPEMYKSAARLLFDSTLGGVSISPNTLYFFANNYVDGFTKLVSTGVNLGMVAAGTKDFDPKNDTLVFNSFFGAPSNFDAKQFSSIEDQIKGIEKRLKTLEKDPGLYMQYVSKNPTHPFLVDYYNSAVNGPLKDTRTYMNDIRANRSMTPKDKKDALDNMKPIQNLIKRNLIGTFEQVSDLEP